MLSEDEKQRWLATRPRNVREILARWPLNSIVTDGDRKFILCSNSLSSTPAASKAAHSFRLKMPKRVSTTGSKSAVFGSVIIADWIWRHWP
jgi:hypothetical protein